MDRNFDFNGFPPPFTYTDFNNDFPPPVSGMFNPINQYEQAYMYYRYMCMFMDYKIKCKEYEKICTKSDNHSRISEK